MCEWAIGKNWTAVFIQKSRESIRESEGERQREK